MSTQDLGVPDGWRVFVANERLIPLMDALEYAHRKGYMPDAIASEYEGFDWRSQPEKACKFDKSLPDVPLLQEQAAAWFLVADTLTEVAEWWHDLEGSGMEKAAQAIRKLAAIANATGAAQ